MIQNINDLSIILSIVSKFHTPIQKKDLLLLLYNKVSYVQWDIQPRELIKTAERLNLFVVDKDLISLTDLGHNIQNISTKGIDLNDKQIMYIADSVLTNPNFPHLTEFLKLFVFDKQLKTMIYNTIDYPISKIEDFELLVQLNIIHKQDAILILNHRYLDLVDEVLHSKYTLHPKAFTQEQLERILTEQKKIGDYAEKLSLQYEKNRLGSKSLYKELSQIRHVSLTNANIGYDIASFEKEAPSLEHDLFIEVKSRKHKLNSFIISDNEVQTAKKLRTKYVIYFWNGLEYRTPSNPTRIIRDPINTLKIQKCDNCLSYIVYLDKYNPPA